MGPCLRRFESLGEDSSVGCTSHPEVRFVFLIDPGLTFFIKNKISICLRTVIGMCMDVILRRLQRQVGHS